jgi:hypothetical protein
MIATSNPLYSVAKSNYILSKFAGRKKVSHAKSKDAKAQDKPWKRGSALRRCAFAWESFHSKRSSCAEQFSNQHSRRWLMFAAVVLTAV